MATSKPLGRRERNKRDKRDRILGAARELFRAQGFAATTAQQIADAADVGFGTLYLYARSKEDLLILVFKDEMDEVVEQAFATVPDDAPLVEQVQHLFGRFLAYHKEDVPLARALLKELAFIDSSERRADVTGLMLNIYGKLADLVMRAQRAGAVRADASPTGAARNFFAAYFQLLQTHLNDYIGDAQYRRMLRTSLDLMIDGLAARPRR